MHLNIVKITSRYLAKIGAACGLLVLLSVSAALAQSCTSVPQRVANPGLLNSFTSWTNSGWTTNALGGQSAQHWNNQGGAAQAVPTGFDTIVQSVTRVSGGARISFDVAWNNAANSAGGTISDGNQARLEVSFNGTAYVQLLTSPHQGLLVSAAPGPSTGSSLSVLAGATLVTGAVPPPSNIGPNLSFVTVVIALPDNIASQTGALRIGVQRLQSANIDGTTDDFYVRNVTVNSRTLCLLKSTPVGSGNFAFTTTNLDIDHVAAGNQNGPLTMNTSSATPVLMPDSDTATTGTQPAFVMANPVTVTESTLATGFVPTQMNCDNGVTASIAGAALSLSTIPSGTAVTCTVVNTPSADLSVTKTNTPLVGPSDQPADAVTAGANVTYRIVVTNNGPAAANGAVVRDDVVSGINCPPANAVTCIPAGGAACGGGPFTVAALTAAGGIALGAMPATSTVALSFTCSVP